MIEPDKMLAFLKQRRSIRRYQTKMIPDTEIEMILEAGRYSPSASNRQPWEFIVIKNKAFIEKLADIAIYGSFVRTAPVVIAVVGKIKKSPKWYVQDTTLASMNMMLMAWVLSIGTCWIGAMDREKAKEILELDKDDFLLTLLPLGYLIGDIPKLTSRKRC